MWCALVARDRAMVDFARRDTSLFFRESDFIVRAMPFSCFWKSIWNGRRPNHQRSKNDTEGVILWVSPLKWSRSISRFSWGLKCCDTSPLSVFGCQQTNEHVYSLNAVNQVPVCHHLLCYRMFHCFSTLYLFCWVTVASLCACESYRTSHYSAGKLKWRFYSPKILILR